MIQHAKVVHFTVRNAEKPTELLRCLFIPTQKDACLSVTRKKEKQAVAVHQRPVISGAEHQHHSSP